MPPVKRWVRRRAGSAWLNLMFFHSRRLPWVVRKFKPFWTWGAWTHSYYLQDNILANARRLLGHRATPLNCDALGRAVVSNFFDFISDIGKSIGQTREQLLARIDRIEGEPGYHAVRAQKKGAIILTAHMGSFEVGMAALLQHEKRVHVLFRRDSFGLFEKTRSELRRQLGVIEECVDEGLPVWIRLREALAKDDVVLIQGDRVMPGQKGRRMPVLGGHMVLPTGPVRLALATGAPIIPIFSIRLPDGKIRLFIEPALYVDESHSANPGVTPRCGGCGTGVSPVVAALDVEHRHHGRDGHATSIAPQISVTPADAAMDRLRSTLERYLRDYPDQWLMVHRAWCEDAESTDNQARCGRTGFQPVRT